MVGGNSHVFFWLKMSTPNPWGFMMIQFDEHAFKLVEATILGEMMIQFDKHIFEKLG